YVKLIYFRLFFGNFINMSSVLNKHVTKFYVYETKGLDNVIFMLVLQVQLFI
ncbi:hypothetical protein L9F63_010737, partial [Diploptera punctata]